MIGQSKIREYVDNLSDTNFPHFIILIGARGSGKTTVAKYISNHLNAPLSICGIKVDDVREVIDFAYKTKERIVYCIQNADTMRAEGKNALLKITEEPPESAYFIMTVTDDSVVLDTLKSRGIMLYMQEYTEEELCEYAGGCSDFAKIAKTPYELDLMKEYGNDFIDFVNLVIDNIAEVEPANAFKSGTKLALKNEAEGYDLIMFFRVFIYLCEKRYEQIKYAKCVITTCKYLNKLMKLGVNKQQVYDMWVFEIRSVLYEFD